MIIFLVWLSGWIAGYFAMRAFSEREIWTIGDRITAILFGALMSWLLVLVSTGFAVYVYFDERFDWNKPAKW